MKKQIKTKIERIEADSKGLQEKVGVICSRYAFDNGHFCSYGTMTEQEAYDDARRQMADYLTHGKQIITFDADCCGRIGDVVLKPETMIDQIARLENPSQVYMYWDPFCYGRDLEEELKPHLEKIPEGVSFILGKYFPGFVKLETEFEELEFNQTGALITNRFIDNPRYHIYNAQGLTDLEVFEELLK